MNLRLFIIFILLSILISSFSCSNKSNRSRKPAVQINIESVNRKICFGDDITIALSVKIKDGELKQVNVFLDTALIISGHELELNKTLNNYKNLGKHTLKVKAIKTDGVEGIYFKNFEVLSDIVPEKYVYELVQTFPHDTSFFTEGFEINKGFLYESTGENGKSAIYKTNLNSGKTIQLVKLSDHFFGEGITIFNNKMYQLTYKTKVGFIYELEKMAVIDSFYFDSAEGWGMTHDDSNLIMSDGTNVLTFLDPTTLKTVKKLQVYDDKNPMVYLNELEYSEGLIYANLWGTNIILKIDSKTGKVLTKIDLDGIMTMYNTDIQIDVLNGIAIDPVTKKMYVTGKRYPKIFEIKPVKKG